MDNTEDKIARLSELEREVNEIVLDLTKEGCSVENQYILGLDRFLLNLKVFRKIKLK